MGVERKVNGNGFSVEQPIYGKVFLHILYV